MPATDVLPALRSQDERNALAEANLALLHWTAKRCTRGRINPSDFEDMAQTGSIGLLRAAELFDESRGLKFSNVAVVAIRRRITRALDRRSLIRSLIRRSPIADPIADRRSTADRRSRRWWRRT